MAAAVLESVDSFKKNLYAQYRRAKDSPEESVANAWALRKDLSPYKAQVERFMRNQPRQYTFFEKYAGQGFTEGELACEASMVITIPEILKKFLPNR